VDFRHVDLIHSVSYIKYISPVACPVTKIGLVNIAIIHTFKGVIFFGGGAGRVYGSLRIYDFNFSV